MNTKRSVVTLSNVLFNVIDGSTQFFAYIDNDTHIPKNAIRVSLGEVGNSNWIEIHPVGPDDSVTLREFLNSGYEVILDDQYSLPPWVANYIEDVEDCRWFAELNE